MMRCDGCEDLVDTDETVEGVWEEATPFRYWCPHCVERAAKDENEALLAALKAQDPEAYKELTDE